MAITLGTYAFDPLHIGITEQYQEIGGRDGRLIKIQGLIGPKDSEDQIEEEMDRLLAAASEDLENTPLSIRPGRRLWVRRTGFSREMHRTARTGAFVVELEARDPFEESEVLSFTPWTCTASGSSKSIASDGNAYAYPILTVCAVGTLIGPAFHDGRRTLRYPGYVQDGQTLVFHGAFRQATVAGQDITPYVQGHFPVIDPNHAVLTYSDEEDSSHNALITVAWRPRWW